MWLVVAAILCGGLWFLFRRWRKTLPTDPRLTISYWRNSGLVLGVYLLSILLGAGITRIMVGFNRGGWADILMLAFFIVWVAYGAVWLLRYLPSSTPKPVWLSRSRVWIDIVGLAVLAGLATWARML